MKNGTKKQKTSRGHRRLLYKKHQGRCQYCGVKTHMAYGGLDPLCATVDHIVARARGGTNDLANKTLACQRCNNRKGDADTKTFRLVLKLFPAGDPPSWVWDHMLDPPYHEVIRMLHMPRKGLGNLKNIFPQERVWQECLG